MKQAMRLGRAVVFLAAVCALFAPCARAQTYFARTSDIWNLATNWSAGLPGIGTNAYIAYPGKTNPAMVAIHATDVCVASNLYVGTDGGSGSATGTLNMDGGSLNVWTLSIGDSGCTGTITQTGGVITDDHFTFEPDGGGGVASWTITGQGTIVSNRSATAGSYIPSHSGTLPFYLTISNNASMVGGAMNVGYSGNSAGIMTIASGGSYTAATGTLVVGYNGDGTLMVSNATLNTGAYGVQVAYANGGTGKGHVKFINASAVINGLSMSDSEPSDMSVTGASAVTNTGSLTLCSHGGTAMFAMTNGYWYQGNAINLGNNAANSTGSMQIASATWVQRGSISVGAGGQGWLTVTNSLFDAVSNSLNAGCAGTSSGSVTFVDSTLLCTNINIPSASGGKASLTVGGASVITNTGNLFLGYGGNGPCLGNVTMTGGTWWQRGTVYVPAQFGNASIGSMMISGGTFLPQSGVYVGTESSNNVGSLILSNVTVSMPSTLTIGSPGSGTVSVVNGGLSVSGTCTMANSAGTGQGAVLIMTNSAVTNWGTVNVTANSATTKSSISQIGGSWSVIGSNVNFGTAGAASYAVSNGVFVETGGTFTLGSTTNVNCPAWVELDGTQRLFQVSNLVVNAYGAFTNHLAGYAGGLDIGLTNATSLRILSTGVVSLVYTQDPTVTGNYWGLRWLGTNGFAVLKTYHTNVPPRLTWNDSALSSYYTNQINIYTGSENNVAYTYVGIKVTYVISKNKGTVMFLQ